MDKSSNSTIFFVVSIDTEEEMEWGKGFKRHNECTVENIKYLDPLHQIFRKHGVKATYLITYPITQNADSVKILKSYRDEGLGEIGAHLHPWCNPPYEERLCVENTFTHNLPEQLQYDKQKVLTNQIAQKFGQKPVSFRAGRYGFDEKFIPILESFDYQVDSSVVPYRLAKREYEPDFGYMPDISPYHLNHENMRKTGNSPVLELPITIGFTQPVPKWIEKKYIYLPDVGIRKAIRLLMNTNLNWLRPSYASLEEMKQLTHTMAARNMPVLNMMFHSNELMPKGSKYNKTAEDVTSYLAKLDDYFNFLNSNFNVEYIGLGEAAKHSHLILKN